MAYKHHGAWGGHYQCGILHLFSKSKACLPERCSLALLSPVDYQQKELTIA